jgi:hypothetical protein
MNDGLPEVSIRMTEETLGALSASGCFLYGLCGVRAADAAGRPAVWLQTRGYAMHTRVRPPAQLLAFTAGLTRPLAEGLQVQAGFHAPAEPGQTLVVALPGGGGEMRERGAPDAVSVLNTTDAQLTCGLACLVDGEAIPFYAAPLYGGALQIIEPLPRVLLFISPQPAPPGTVVSTTTGPGVLLHLAPGADAQLEFHVNAGWSWGDGVRAERVPAQSDLLPLLVEYPSPAAPRTGLG